MSIEYFLYANETEPCKYSTSVPCVLNSKPPKLTGYKSMKFIEMLG